jgi:Ca-activated chloride channel family protein
MSKFGRKYNFVQLIVWTITLEVLFWLVFFFGHFWIANAKNEPFKQAFTAYEHPEYFWFFLLIPLLYLFYFSNLSWKNQLLGTLFSPRLQRLLICLPSNKQSFWRFQVLRISLVFIVLAVANPQGAPKKITIDTNNGEIIVVVDVSKSMLVQDMDMKRSRLDAAKNGLSNLAQNLNGTSLSIVVFAGSAYAHMPMTRDLSGVSTYIQDISTDMIGVQGTQIAEALDIAYRTFSTQIQRKTLYLISDGEDHEGGLDEAIQRIVETGTSVHVIALGTEKGGPIPEPNGGVKRDKNNEIIISKPNIELLQKIANQSGGVFVQETNAFPNFVRIVEKTYLAEQNKTKQESTMRKSHGNIYALTALLFLLFYLVLLELNFQKKSERNE